MRNIKLLVAYDGTSYLGWQATPEGPSIEAAIKRVLERILCHPVTLQAASRTDAGVHADNQVANFFLQKDCFCLYRLKMGLKALLPKDIVVTAVDEVHESFHPTLDCKGKEYHYWIDYGSYQMPRHRTFSWHYPYALDVDQMQRAAAFFVGQHDFSAFCNVKKNEVYESCLRAIESIQIEQHEGHRMCIRIKGKSFLYKMVRNLVGTLAFVGRGKISAESIPLILASRDRTQAGMTSPPQGLSLHQCFF